MIAYTIVQHGQPLERVERETPKPTGTEVLMRITHCGVCHSDLHLWNGYFDLGGGKRFYVKDRGVLLPHTLGHEPLGTVEALGPRARGVRIGAKRLVYPWIGCGACAACGAGRETQCLKHRFIGISKPGGYATHLLVPHPQYLLDPGGIDDGFAATLACAGLTAQSAINKLPKLGAKDWIAVLGCGGLGLMALSILRAAGRRNVIACDVDAEKLAAAKTLGARHALDTRPPDAVQQLMALARGNLVAALDFVGLPATANLALPALARGGRYIICGLFGGEITLSLAPLAQRGIALIGSYVGSLAELKQVLALAKRGKLKPTPVETRPAAAINRTLVELDAGRILGRVVLSLEAETAALR